MHAAILIALVVQLHQMYSVESQIRRKSYQLRPWKRYNFILEHAGILLDVIEEFLISPVPAINRRVFRLIGNIFIFTGDYITATVRIFLNYLFSCILTIYTYLKQSYKIKTTYNLDIFYNIIR